MSPTRRQLLTGAAGGLSTLAGCSALAGSQQSLRISVINATEMRRQFHLLVENDGTEIVRQFFEVPAETPNDAPQMETTITLGELSSGTRLDVTAWVDDTPPATVPVTLDCGDEYGGDAVGAQIEVAGVQLNGDSDGNTCYDDNYSAANDSTWG